MAVLLLRLCGVMQSWGTDSRFLVRKTDPEPSKSGVVGLLCAALGRGRGEDISDLAALRMGQGGFPRHGSRGLPHGFGGDGVHTKGWRRQVS